MSDSGWNLQRAYDEGYKDGKRDAASPWHRVEEPPKKDGWYMLCFLSRWRDGYWWIPNFPDYWIDATPPKEDA